MAARTARGTLMDAARDRARAFVRAAPAGDRIMLVRADALSTPATAFEPDHAKLEDAIAASQPGSTALNLEQALAFARQIQTQGGRRAGEVVFVGTGKLAEREPGKLGLRNLRFLAVPDAPGGCPWDREQTFDSITKYTVEETYEVLEAIAERDWEELPGELGDLLLQVLFYAEMAGEEGHFSIDEVLETLSEKLVRRHPHVFGEVEAATPRGC